MIIMLVRLYSGLLFIRNFDFNKVNRNVEHGVKNVIQYGAKVIQIIKLYTVLPINSFQSNIIMPHVSIIVNYIS